MPTDRREARRTLGLRRGPAIEIGLILLPLILFARVVPGDFLNWDDWQMVSSNLDLRPGHWHALLAYWHRPHLGLFIPLTYSLYALVEALSTFVAGALQPCWFHATNLTLHAANGLLFWRILKRLGGDQRAAALGVAVFLVHPLQVEAVAWISSLNTLLAAFLVLLSVWLYLRSIEASIPSQSLKLLGLCCLTSALAMLAKPSACVLPLIALALHAILPRRDLRKGVARCVIIFLIQAPFAWIAHRVQGGSIQLGIPLRMRALVALDAVGFYVLKLFAPAHLAIDYGRVPSHVSVGLPMALGAIFLLLLLAFAAIPLLRRRKWALAGMLIFVAGLLPVLGLVPFDFQFYSTVADRYAYISMFGPAIVVTDLLRSGAGLVVWRSIVMAGVLLLLAVISFLQAGVWTSDARLFQQALAVNPQSIAANQTLGFLAAQAADGAQDAHRRDQLLQFAITYDNRALAVNPDNPRARFNRANLYLRMRYPAQALADYSAAAGKFDDEAELQNNWGVACLQMNQNQEALKHFRCAIALDASFADAYANAGTAFLHLDDLAQARKQFGQALALNPNQPQAISGLRKMQAMGW